jgi:hypothetical protein
MTCDVTDGVVHGVNALMESWVMQSQCYQEIDLQPVRLESGPRPDACCYPRHARRQREHTAQFVPAPAGSSRGRAMVNPRRENARVNAQATRVRGVQVRCGERPCSECTVQGQHFDAIAAATRQLG